MRANTILGSSQNLASPSPELIIRTGGEMQIGNFLLWEASQAELFFTPTLWPDFDGESLDEAVAAFQS